MNNLIQTKSFILAAFFAFLSLTVEAGPFYVVVGSFSEQGDARRFANGIREHFSEASFKFDGVKKLYHVHVMETGEHHEAGTFRDHLREEKGFVNAWVYTDFASTVDPGGRSVLSSNDYVSLELFTGGTILLGSADNSYLAMTKNRGVNRDSVRSAGNTFAFIAETAAGRSIGASISLVDNRGNEVSSFKTGEDVVLNSRDGGVLMLVCRVPGYSTEMKMLHLGRLSDVRDLRRRPDNVWELRFQVRKLKIDELRLQYQETFHEDAAILQSGSKAQLDELLSLLEKNPGWRVVFNVHCNPGIRRKIALPGSANDHFDITEAREISATDNRLTDERGRILKDYLVSKGIDAKRISVMGWGSVNLLVPDTDKNAGINERVVVEFVF